MSPALLGTDPRDAASLQRSLSSRPYLVVGLCAAWCNTCDEFRSGFAALAAARTDATFVWLDIEDDADTVGEIDVENFPTIAIYHAGRLVHFGVSLPQAPLVGRLLTALHPASATPPADEAVRTLPARLAACVAAADVSVPQGAN